MKFEINYYAQGKLLPSTVVVEAKNENDAMAKFQDANGNNSGYEIASVGPQYKEATKSQVPAEREQIEDEKKSGALSYFVVSNESFSQKREGKGSIISKGLSGSNAALASESEAEDKLTAYKARQTAKEQEPIWFYTVDGENIEGPVGLASIQSKVDQGILKEDSLVMKTGDDWMTISEFKTTGSSIADSKSFSSFAQSHNARPLPAKATASSPRSTQTAYKPSPYSSSNKSPTSVAAEHGFFQKLSSGEFGLAKTYWLYGVVVGVVLSLGIRAITSMGLLTVIVLTYTAYQTLVLIGTWRASKKYEGWNGWAILAKVAVVLGAIWLIGTVIMTVGLYAKS